MRIVQVCHRYYPNRGGVENHVREISRRLAKKYDVEVICADRNNRGEVVEMNGVKIRRFKAISPNNAYFFAPQIFSYIKDSDFDIIHAHNYHAFPALFASLAKDDRKFIFTPHYHGVGSTTFRNLLNKFYKFLGYEIFKRADKIICVSNYEKEIVRRDFGISEEDIVVIPNGINVQEIKKAKPFEFDGALILYIGRLEKYKNIHFVIEAMKYLPEDFYFYIGGKGNYERNLKNLIYKLGLEGRVRFLGYIPDEEKYRWMKTCSLFVNLSSVEAFGMTVLEALAAGKPVIVNDKGGLREIAEKFDGVLPVCVERLSAGQLASIIKGVTGRSVSADVGEYDWGRVVDRIEEVYETLHPSE